MSEEQSNNKSFFRLNREFITDYFRILSHEASILYIYLASRVNVRWVGEGKNKKMFPGVDSNDNYLENFECWPSQSTIMNDINIKSKSILTRAINELISFGLITNIYKKYPKSLTSPNAYVIDMLLEEGDTVNDALIERRRIYREQRSKATKERIARKKAEEDVPVVLNQNSDCSESEQRLLV